MSNRTGNPLLFLAALVLAGCQGSADKPRLLVFCAAGLRPPVAEAADKFGREQGVLVECDYAGSEVLLSRVKLSRQGDIYLPGDLSYVEQARSEGLVAASKTVCQLVPVILVERGNPHGIKTLSDLVRPEIRLGLGDPKACAIGRQSAEIFAKNGIAEADLQRSVVMRALTVNELGNSVKLKALDATIIWDAVAASYAADAETIAIPREQNVISTVPAAILTCSRQPDLAQRFIDFLSKGEGAAIFRKHHYTTEQAK